MKTRNLFFCLPILLMLAHLGAGVPRPQGGSRRDRVTVKGRIVGYSFASTLRFISGSISGPPHDEFLFMVEEGDKELKKLKFIKLMYRPEQHEPKELPEALFRESRRRRFVVERDETCDESAASFVRGHTFELEEPRAQQQIEFQNLQRLPGMENLSVPEEGTFRCYSFEWNDIAK